MTKSILLLFLFLSGTGRGAGGDFERLKSLVGEWEATSSYGKSQVVFQLTANGTALLETVGSGAEAMVTVYHPDGETTLLTHYCSAGNQPRMRAQKTSDGKTLTFNFVDAANLKDGSSHMSRLVMTFQDDENVIEEWTWKDKGKEESHKFHLRRVKK
jgi:hypothetical protein